MSSFAEACLSAWQQRRNYPAFTGSMPESDISLASAYAAQRAYVDLRTRQDDIVGYKAALTAPPAQTAMGIDAPIVGALFASGAWQAHTDISLAEHLPGSDSGGLLETELGYVLARDINAPVTTDVVLTCVDHCVPTVEVACPNLSERPSGVDLIATNSASAGFICGEAFENFSTTTADHLDAVHASLMRHATGNATQDTTIDPEVLFGGLCAQVMGSQVAALTWLINTVLELGYPLSTGHLLMTGSVGGVAPGLPGGYVARYSQLPPGLANGAGEVDIPFTLSI